MNQRYKRFMNKIHIREISAVDLPAQEHATIAIIKRRDDAAVNEAMLKTQGELLFMKNLKAAKKLGAAECRRRMLEAYEEQDAKIAANNRLARLGLKLGKAWGETPTPPMTPEEEAALAESINTHAADEADEEIAIRADKDKWEQRNREEYEASKEADDETEENDEMNETIELDEDEAVMAVAKGFGSTLTDARKALALAESEGTVDELMNDWRVQDALAQMDGSADRSAIKSAVNDQLAKRRTDGKLRKRNRTARTDALRELMYENPEAFGYQRG